MRRGWFCHPLAAPVRSRLLLLMRRQRRRRRLLRWWWRRWRLHCALRSGDHPRPHVLCPSSPPRRTRLPLLHVVQVVARSSLRVERVRGARGGARRHGRRRARRLAVDRRPLGENQGQLCSLPREAQQYTMNPRLDINCTANADKYTHTYEQLIGMRRHAYAQRQSQRRKRH